MVLGSILPFRTKLAPAELLLAPIERSLAQPSMDSGVFMVQEFPLSIQQKFLMCL